MDDNGEEDSEGGFEIHELVFAESIGVNLEEEFAAELLEIAVKALYTLPEDWVIEISESAELGKIPFFYNQVTGESQWTHPFMEEFANVVKEHRLELYQGYTEGEEEGEGEEKGQEDDEILVSEEDMKKDIERLQVTLLDQPINGISQQVSTQFGKFIDDDDKNEYVEVKSPLRESAKVTPRLEEVQLSSPEELLINKEENELAGNEVILPASSNEDFVGPPIESPLSVKVAQTGNPRKLRISRASLSLRTDMSVSQEDLVQINERFLTIADHINASQVVEEIKVEKEIVVETVKPKRPISRPSRPDSAVEEQDPIEKPAAKSSAKNNAQEDEEDTVQARDGELPMDIGTTFAISTEYDGHSCKERPLVAMDDNSTVATGDELASLLDRPTEILDDCPVKVLTKKDSSERALINMALGADLFGSEQASVVGSFVSVASPSAAASVAISAAPLDEVSLQEELHLVDDASSVISAVTAEEPLAANSAEPEQSADEQPTVVAELCLDVLETAKVEVSPIDEANKLVAQTTTEIFGVASKSKFVFVDAFPDFFKVESKFLEMVEAKVEENDINTNKDQDIDRLLATALHGDRDNLKNFNMENDEVEIENGDEDDDGSQVTQKKNEKCDDHELVEINNRNLIKITSDDLDDVDILSSTVQPAGQMAKSAIASVSDIAEDDNDIVIQTNGIEMQMEDLEKTTAKEPRLLNILDDERFQGSHKPVEPLDKNIDVADHFAQLFQGSTLMATSDGPATNSTNPSSRPSARGRAEGDEAKRTVVDSRPSESPSVVSRVSSAKGGNAKWISKQPVPTIDGAQANNNAVKVNIPRKTSANKNRVASGSRKWVTLGKYGSYREANLATKLFESIYPSQSYVDKSFPIFRQEEYDSANNHDGDGSDDVENQNGGSRLALLMRLDGNVDTKTMQRSIGKEIPKLRISRDLSRMQWLVECSDPHAKKVFQGRVAHKRALSPLRSGPQLPMTTLTDPLAQGSIMSNNIDGLDMGGGIAAQSSVFTAPFSPRRLLTTTGHSYHLSSRLPLVYPGPSLHGTHNHSMTMSTTSINNNSIDRHGSAKKRVFSAGRLSMLPPAPSDANITVTSLHGQPLSAEMLNRYPSLIDKPFAPKTFRHLLLNGGSATSIRPHSSR